MLGAVATTTRGPLERFRRRWTHRLRVLEAVVLLTAAAAAQRWVPMPRWSGVLGRPAAVPADWHGHAIIELPVAAASLPELHTVRAVRRASRLVPWSPRCLAEATTAQMLLRQQGHPGVVVIGLRPPADGSATTWDAHAWLLGHAGALTGGPAAQGFTATTVFEVPGALRAADVQLGDAHAS